jgi:hypothetical protein
MSEIFSDRIAIPSSDTTSSWLSEPQLALVTAVVVMLFLLLVAPPFVQRREDNNVSFTALLGWGVVSGGAMYGLGWMGY